MENKLNNNLHNSRGSLWRKWDLHVHPPGTKLNDGYKIDGNKDIWDKFCKRIEQSDVAVFGITDYFSADGYKNFIKKYESKYPKSKKRFFLNIELRLNESVNKQFEEVNVHLIFNPSSVGKVDKFLSELKVVKTVRKDQVPIKCSELKTTKDYESATTTRDYLNEAFKNTFGKKAIRKEHFLVFTAANYDGIRSKRGVKRKEAISDEIDKFSDGFFGDIQNQEYFLKTDRLEERKLLIDKKPVISGSDAHSFNDMDKFLNRSFIEKSADGNEKIIKDVTWIKVDPTFEGLRQILYEPEPGDRVWIGPDIPNKKENFQVIRKIKFSNTSDFPEEIEFNQNLCSIIGGRSSGKSALLAYITHAVDKKLVEELIEGPGEGEEYKWNKIKIDYEIEWDNNLSNEKSPGEVIYISQNYLFNRSKDPEEIKRKIEPVLFKKLPEFEKEYKKSTKGIDDCNKKISDLVKEWFHLSDSIVGLQEKVRNLGDKEAIEKEKNGIKQKINKHKKKHSLNEGELKEYQKIESKITKLKSKIAQNNKDLENFQSILREEETFQSLKLEPEPSIGFLPKTLEEKINDELIKNEKDILQKINKIALEYKENLNQNIENFKKESQQILKDNKILIDKYKKNEALEKLLSKFNEYEEKLKSIVDYENEIKKGKTELENKEKKIKEFMDERTKILEVLRNSLINLDQKDIDIRFNIEYKIKTEDLKKVAQKINLKKATNFVEDCKLKIKIIRQKPDILLKKIYSREQKINSGYKKDEVATELLTLTETILFVGEMENDKIGGFSETTMTPGRSALFFLKLILAESDDKWPLLIDQPEDNLDSRSIVEEIVPFLREKKKERQIIMVSHNANFIIGADSEQIIVANRNGSGNPNKDGKQFNYLTGGIEYTKEKDKSIKDTLKCQGVREHACLILDGGKKAFEHRMKKYNLDNF